MKSCRFTRRKYEASIELARQHLVENREKLLLHVIVYDATVTIEGTSSDAIVIEATEVGQEGTFKLLRRYAPPGLFSKASAEEKLTFVAYEPFKKSG
jgi:phenylpropionate dioxygenase-like ring-hydroxylating dioxygenase large terminal subunit